MTLSVALIVLGVAIALAWLVVTKRFEPNPSRDRRILNWLRTHRELPPSFGASLLREKWLLAFNAGIAFVGFWLLAADQFMGGFFIGLGVGSLGANIGSIAVHLRAFLAYRSVIDWVKVEDALASPPNQSR